MKAKIALGLGFGDEGKGTTTDFLCKNSPNPIVVRFNGGHQAGHTVIRGGIKHTFASFGSGTILGCPTYISEHCCFYPPSIQAEREVLLGKGITPNLYIHPLAKLTTPYDIAFNRLSESRLKHGSVGVGIGTTFSRNTGMNKLHAADILCPTLLDEKMIAIQGYYSSLLQSYNGEELRYYDSIVKEEKKFFYKAVALERFNICSYDMLGIFDTVVFEGAQGILLDMDMGLFPNVTYAHCTSRNAIEICNKVGIEKREVHYVTRCYQTRHGNGWMSNENPIELVNTQEEINVTGPWQGNFRVGELDTKLINYAIACDNAYSFDCKKYLHVTCMDQRPGFTFPYEKITHHFVSMREQFSASADSQLNFGIGLKQFNNQKLKEDV